MLCLRVGWLVFGSFRVFFYSKGFRGASAKMLKGAVPLLAWVLVPVLSTIFSLTVRD